MRLKFNKSKQVDCERRSSLMVSALVPGASGPGSSASRGHCVVFLGSAAHNASSCCLSTLLTLEKFRVAIITSHFEFVIVEISVGNQKIIVTPSKTFSKCFPSTLI